ncbi:Bax inhibitor-1/YccA family protein [Leifsonia flava]|uniref:Bax inhibitor-1/YccA family protein n=1 Tax=Orlajensenia leifsoniae TaxID=2561933 RepID=A0A4Y9R6C8_9MICO|nr:Bax inhibitor-1 family protein [Leifsonia flava]TFW00172.1 hypothetical protein E4M00_03010 [Leifsonia flava]
MTNPQTRSESPSLAHDRTRSVFAQTMGFVALTAALFAGGAYLGQNLTGGVGILAFIASLACLIGMQFSTQKANMRTTVALLAAFGLTLGLAVAPTLADYARADPTALWQAGWATALLIAGFGIAGWNTRVDLTALARVLSWALLGLIVFGIVVLFFAIPGGSIIYSVVGLVIFAGYTLFDFQRLRRSSDVESAPLLAASIFLDILNVFLLFVGLFSRDK